MVHYSWSIGLEKLTPLTISPIPPVQLPLLLSSDPFDREFANSGSKLRSSANLFTRSTRKPSNSGTGDSGAEFRTSGDSGVCKIERGGTVGQKWSQLNDFSLYLDDCDPQSLFDGRIFRNFVDAIQFDNGDFAAVFLPRPIPRTDDLSPACKICRVTSTD